MGHYPGAVFQEEATTQIYGHIFELKNPDYSLPILDKCEAVGEQFGQYKEYVREIVPIKLEEQIISCWAYVYVLPTENLPLIESGNYSNFLKNSRKHQDFIKSV